jgi:glutamine amidotransferase PdxT
MKKIRFTKTAAVLMTLALAAIAIGVPSVALAYVDTVVISAGSSTTIPVGGQVSLTTTLTPPAGESVSNPVYVWTPATAGDIVLSSTTTDATTVTGRVPNATPSTVSVAVTDDNTSSRSPTTSTSRLRP